MFTHKILRMEFEREVKLSKRTREEKVTNNLLIIIDIKGNFDELLKVHTVIYSTIFTFLFFDLSDIWHLAHINPNYSQKTTSGDNLHTKSKLCIYFSKK